MDTPLVGHQADRAAERRRPGVGEGLVAPRPVEGRVDGGAAVGEDRVDGRRGGVGGPLPVGGEDVGGNGEDVKRPPHRGRDPVDDPLVGRLAGYHADQPRRLPGEDAAPDVEIALRLKAGDLPVVEAGIFGAPGDFIDDPSPVKPPAVVPDLV